MATTNGTNGGDTLYGTSSADTINGLGGNDTLKGFGGADRLDGGAGWDLVFYGDSSVGVSVNLATGRGFGGSAEGDTLISIEGVYGSSHNDTLIGNDSVNDLYGLGGNDVLKGGGGADGLAGGDGDDILKGGGGADYLEGGAGLDTADYSQAGPTDGIWGVWADLLLNQAFRGEAAGDTFSGIENLTGSAYHDFLRGNHVANVLRGNAGHDELLGYGGNDTLIGGADNDVLDGGSGVDTMIGGTGDDTYYVDSTSDSVIEYAGEGSSDSVVTSVSYALAAGCAVELLRTTDQNSTVALNLTGNEFANIIFGNNGANIINGGDGDDNISGREGNDTLDGGAGNDLLSGGFFSTDTMIGGEGSDTFFVLNSSAVVIDNSAGTTDQVWANVSYTLAADADIEILKTYNSNQTTAINLTGNAAQNTVIGNNGNNNINGGAGNDQLTGGGGPDTFIFATALNAATNVDTITDYNVADDTIFLDDAVFAALPEGTLSANSFVIGTAALDATDHIIYNGTTGALLYDSDGVNGAAAIQFAQLSAGLALTHLDFLVD